MTTPFSFSLRELALARAATSGALAAAELLALSLRSRGYKARVATRFDGTAIVTLQDEAAVAREFGTLKSSPQPVLGPAVAESRPRMMEAMARAIAQAIRP